MAQYLQEVWSDEYCAGLWWKYIENNFAGEVFASLGEIRQKY